MQLAVSDDPTENWATIGVKVLSVALVPQSGSNVTIVTMPSPAPVINLLQLDELGEIIGNATNVPVGTYTTMQLTLSANASDVSLVVSNDPEAGFDLSAKTIVPSSQIQVVGSVNGLPNVARGFKVNVAVDPLSTTTPPTALSVEIDVARYNGAISDSGSTGFTYTRNFHMADGLGGKDDYTGTIDYISSSSSNTDQQGAAIDGFYWWDFTYPTQEDIKSTAIADFVTATTASVNFGGAVGYLVPRGVSNAAWNDSAASDAWSAKWTVLTPVPAPLGTVSSPFSSATNSFGFSVPAVAGIPANPVTVNLSTTSGSATLVYQVDRQGSTITITPKDITNATTLAAVGAALVASPTATPVKVFGVPLPTSEGGGIQAYELFYYQHTASAK